MQCFIQKFWLVIGLPLALCIQSLSAGPLLDQLFADHSFDLSSLVKLAATVDPEKMLLQLQAEFGVTALEIPSEASDLKEETFSAEAWYYFHHPMSEDIGGAFALAFGLAAMPHATLSNLYVLQNFSHRPFGDRDLIFVRRPAQAYVLLHEFTHYLISEKKRLGLKLSKSDFAKRQSSRLDKLYFLDERWAKGELRTFERIEMMSLQFDIVRTKLLEEVAINLKLLENSRSLRLRPSEEQSLLLLIRGDLEKGYLAKYRASLVESRMGYASHRFGDLVAAVDQLLLRIDSAIEESKALVDEFLVGRQDLRELEALAHSKVYLVPSKNSLDPFERLGIPTATEIDAESFKRVTRFWAWRTHHAGLAHDVELYDRTRMAKSEIEARVLHLGGGTDAETFALARQTIGTEIHFKMELRRRSDLAKERARQQAQETLISFSRLQRWFFRFGGMCAMSALYCSIDGSFPWNQMRHSVDHIPFGFGMVVMNLAVSTLEKDGGGIFVKQAPKAGLKSAVVRGLVVGACWEALKFVARHS